tara:strand:- start:3025 stop:3927 length:903 start_codon:yes stop_codon:yes gene_type:complete
MNLDIAIQNTLKRGPMENAMHGVMDNHGGRYQLTSYTSSAKGAEAILGTKLGTMSNNPLSRPTSTRKVSQAESMGPLSQNIGAGYELEFNPTGEVWTLYRLEEIPKTSWERVTSFFGGDSSEVEIKKTPTIQRGGTYSLNRFLTVLQNRSDLTSGFKDQITTLVIQHANGATSNPDFTTPETANQAAGQIVTSPSIAYAEGVTTPFGTEMILTPSLAKTSTGSQPLSAQSFNSSNVTIHARGTRTQDGGFGGPTLIPTPLTRSQMGTVRDALGNKPNQHITQGVRVPHSALSQYSNGRSL